MKASFFVDLFVDHFSARNDGVGVGIEASLHNSLINLLESKEGDFNGLLLKLKHEPTEQGDEFVFSPKAADDFRLVSCKDRWEFIDLVYDNVRLCDLEYNPDWDAGYTVVFAGWRYGKPVVFELFKPWCMRELGKLEPACYWFTSEPELEFIPD